MPLSSDAVGCALGEREAVVTTRDVLAYAAGIGSSAPLDLDDAAQDGLVAAPAYCVSLEWPVVSGARQRDALGVKPDEAIHGVHARQDSTFHRPIQPGDALRTVGRLTSARASRAGAIAVSKLETSDVRTGEPVVTSWSTSIYRGVALQGEDRACEEPPASGPTHLPSDSVHVAISVSRELPHVYTECARIWNPIHTERSVALAAGLPDIILHGTATWALVARELVARELDANPRRLRRLAGSFRAMVIPGTEIALRYAETSPGRFAFEVLNDAGERAISDGLAIADS